MRHLLIFLLVCFGNLINAQETLRNTAKSLVKFEDTGDAIIATLDGKPVLQYNYGMQFPPEGKKAYYQRSGFIHPVYTPSGDTITEAFPEGHTHQHGVFNAWVNTEFKGKKIDFWNQHDETGTVIFKEILAQEETENYSRLTTKQHHLALLNSDTTVVLEEIWTITIYNSFDPFIWDIAVEQTNVSTNSLNFRKYHYGGMAFRGRGAWDHSLETHQAQDTLNFYTEEHQDRNKVNHSQAQWITMTGSIEGRNLSLSVIPSKGNFRAPEFIRVHPDMPYFCFTPFVEEGYTLNPGQTITNTYRVVTKSGTFTNEELDRLRLKFIDN